MLTKHLKSFVHFLLKVIFCFSLISNANAFEGLITFDVIESSESAVLDKYKIILGVKDELLRFDYINSKSGNKETTVVMDYKKMIVRLITSQKTEVIDITKPYQNPSFIFPEEVTKTKNKKSIQGSSVEEHESFYFYDKLRLPLTSWYSNYRVFNSYKPVWHLHKIHTQVSLFNFFINPVTKQISLELVIGRMNGSKIIYKCSEIKRLQLTDSYFSG